MTLKAKDIRKAARILRRRSVPPATLTTQEMVDAVNFYEGMLGLPGDWKIGDKFYTVMRRV